MSVSAIRVICEFLISMLNISTCIFVNINQTLLIFLFSDAKIRYEIFYLSLDIEVVKVLCFL